MSIIDPARRESLGESPGDHGGSVTIVRVEPILMTHWMGDEGQPREITVHLRGKSGRAVLCISNSSSSSGDVFVSVDDVVYRRVRRGEFVKLDVGEVKGEKIVKLWVLFPVKGRYNIDISLG